MSDKEPTIPTAPQPDSSRPSPVLILFAIIPILGIIAALVMLASSNTPASIVEATSEGTRSTVPILDSPMDDFSITTMDGQTLQLSDFAGRPIFLNFWGTWCPPCVTELPALDQFAAEQAALPNGAVVIASNNTETIEDITAYFTENELNLPHILFVQDTESELYRWFGIFQMPTTYVIDAEQIVRQVKFGPFTEQSLLEYLEKVQPPVPGA